MRYAGCLSKRQKNDKMDPKLFKPPNNQLTYTPLHIHIHTKQPACRLPAQPLLIDYSSGSVTEQERRKQ